MNRTNKQTNNLPEERERNLLLSEIDRDIASVEAEGFGRIVIEIKEGRIVNWWKTASRTRRNFLRKIENAGYRPDAN